MGAPVVGAAGAQLGRTVGRSATNTLRAACRTSGTTPAAALVRRRPGPTYSACSAWFAAYRPATAGTGPAPVCASWRAQRVRTPARSRTRSRPTFGASGARSNRRAWCRSRAATGLLNAARRCAGPTAARSLTKQGGVWATHPALGHTPETAGTAADTVRVGASGSSKGWLVATHCADPAPVPVKRLDIPLRKKLSGYEACGPPPPVVGRADPPPFLRGPPPLPP